MGYHKLYISKHSRPGQNMKVCHCAGYQPDNYMYSSCIVSLIEVPKSMMRNLQSTLVVADTFGTSFSVRYSKSP